MAGRGPALPIEAVLPDLLAILAHQSNAVLIAPPGAGKTTFVAPALIGQPWCTGKIMLLSPRRLAARAAAERMAELLGEPVGKTVGYATRFDSKSGPESRIIVVTEGIFKNQILADPELEGVSAVLFDEVHERNLDSDFSLALALDTQAAFRPDLRLIAMSATLDGGRFAGLMGDAPIIESEGKSHPLSYRYLGRNGAERIEQAVAAAIGTALRDEAGDILAFLPGVREIDRTADLLEGRGVNIVIHKLHGKVDPALQRQAIRADKDGKRKVILATSIAETSLTIDGVRVVIDSGLARRPRYDKAAGIVRLVTERVSQASATQRAGRAARQAAGMAYRLWEEAATTGLIRFDPPEILERDLTAMVLDSALWGATDLATLRWLDEPPASAVQEARKRLQALDALDADGRATAHGRKLAALPLDPALAHMLIRGGEQGQAERAADVAMLISEIGLGGRSENLVDRLEHWRRQKDEKSKSARQTAQRWARQIRENRNGSADDDELSVGALVALAYPERLSKRRDGSGEHWISAGGRGFKLDPLSPLAREEWLAVADVQGAAGGARIMSAAPISEDEVQTLFADRIETVRTAEFDLGSERVTSERQVRLGAIVIKRGQDSEADAAMIADALVNAVRKSGLDKLPWSKSAESLRQRATYAGKDMLDDEALLDALDEWLLPLVQGKRRLSEIDVGGLTQALQNRLGWDGLQQVEKIAPSHFTTPAGTSHPIDYDAAAGPTVEARVQAFFGLNMHPAVGDPPIPLILSLTSPAGRPIQTTQDLPGFWTGSWRDVAKEMRGRYPKHPWPDDPASAMATVRTKKADARRNNS